MREHVEAATRVIIFSVVAFALVMASHAGRERIKGTQSQVAAIEAQVEAMMLAVEELEEEVRMLREVTLDAFRRIEEELSKWELVELWSTGYAPFDNLSGMCADENPWSTATGTVPGPGTIAVNPAVIPYGTRMYIEGYGRGEALDTGGAIRARDDLIDLFFETHAEAIAWGRRKVRVLKEVSGQ